jgi:hypothetical protein
LAERRLRPVGAPAFIAVRRWYKSACGHAGESGQRDFGKDVDQAIVIASSPGPKARRLPNPAPEARL